MKSAQLVVKLVLVSFALKTSTHQVRYDVEIEILKQRLQQECPGVDVSADDVKVDSRIYYEKLLRKFIECQQKTIAPAATSMVTPTPSTSSLLTTRGNNSQSVTTTNAPTHTTSAACDNAEVSLKFLNFSNPTNQKATGEPCDPRNNSSCKIYLNICLGPTKIRKCDYLNMRTDVSNQSSPSIIKFEMPVSNLKQLYVFITAWNRDINDEFDSIIDEFTLNFTDLYIGAEKLTDVNGIRTQHPTRLRAMLTVSGCSQTTNTTTLPLECLNATNLTQAWRLEHNGLDIKGGGPHAHPKGYACDLHNELGWFRFTGQAGSHILDKCPKWRSCGTYVPLWSDELHPKVVGKSISMRVYGVYYTGSCKKTVMGVQVMRCSQNTNFDFIYKYPEGIFNPGSCAFAFCSTN